MARRAPDLHATLSAIYEAGIDVDSREELLDRVIDFCGAERAATGLIELSSRRVHLADTREIDLAILESFAQEYDSRSPFALDEYAQLPAGAVLHPGSVLDQAKLRASPIYRDVLEPGGMVDAITAVLSRSDDFHSFLSVYRGEEAGLFDETSVAAMQVLAPHMVRARRIDLLLTAQERRRFVTEGALDQLGAAVVVVAASGRVEFANRAAEALLSEADGVSHVDGELVCDRVETSRHLKRLVLESLERAAGWSDEAGGVVAIRRPSGRRDLRARVAPLGPRLPRSLGISRHEAPAVLVVLSETTHADESPERLLGELFELTSAEARVAWALARGLSLDEYAEEAGLALSTVRSQLKLVFSKTGTRRQAELVSLVLRSLSPFRA